jgi:hypothetical protein
MNITNLVSNMDLAASQGLQFASICFKNFTIFPFLGFLGALCGWTKHLVWCSTRLVVYVDYSSKLDYSFCLSFKFYQMELKLALGYHRCS